MEPTPRDIKTLLTILRYHISRYGVGDGGMCEMIRERIPGSAISETERGRLFEYLKVNAPGPVGTGTRSYWWPRGETAPRLKWLDEQIEDWNKRNEKAALRSFLNDFNTTGMLMDEPEDTIDIPILEGYEIDTQKSSSGNIVLKRIKSKLPKTWEELKKVRGFYVNNLSSIERMGNFSTSLNDNRNIWPTVEEAEASLALAQLCQLRDRYNGQEGMEGCDHLIYCKNASGVKDTYACYVLSFKTRELADEFSRNFRDLIEQAAPLL